MTMLTQSFEYIGLHSLTTEIPHHFGGTAREQTFGNI